MNKTQVKEPTQTKAESVKIGKYELPIQASGNAYVPTEKTVIVNSVHELETLALGIKQNLPVLLVGDTGTGKTSFIRHLARLTNNGFRRLNLNGSTTTDELVGHYVVDDKQAGMRWVDGVLLDAMKNGYWLLLDELNAGLPEVLFVLQSVLDDDKFLVVSEHEGEIVKPHPNFRIFATMNPSLEYAGTKDLNKALLSRFPIVIQTSYPDPVREMEILKTHVPELKEKDANLMVRTAEEIRKGRTNRSISFICSTRELIYWAKLAQSMSVKDASELAVLNKCELETDRKTVEDILKLQIGKWDKKQLLSIAEVEAEMERMKLEVGQFKKNATNNEKLVADQGKQIQDLKATLELVEDNLNQGLALARKQGKPTAKLEAMVKQIDKALNKAEKIADNVDAMQNTEDEGEDEEDNDPVF